MIPTSGDGELAVSPEAAAVLRRRLTSFAAATVENAGAEHAVVALDGGLESAVVAALVTDGLGPDRVTALVMPAHLTSESAARDAEALAEALGLDPERVHLGPLLAAFRETVGTAGAPDDDTVAIQNGLARLRMACTYYVANTAEALVFGDVTRTERLLGSVTKHGGLGVDALPLGACYRTEVGALADELEIPEAVTSAPGERFDATPSDAESLGIDDRTLDELLVAMVDEGYPPATAAERVGVDSVTAERVEAWRSNTAHKRRLPLLPGGNH